MRVETELSYGHFCVLYVGLTKDDKILLKEFAEGVAIGIEEIICDLDESKRFSEHTDAAKKLLYDVIDYIGMCSSCFGLDSIDEYNKELKMIKANHKKFLKTRECEVGKQDL